MNKLSKTLGRYKRLLLPSPAEKRFKACMGLYWYIYGFKREHAAAGFYIDAATTRFHKVAIEVDGAAYHTNVVRDWERDQALMREGWSVLRIPAKQLYRNPRKVRREALQFIRRAP